MAAGICRVIRNCKQIGRFFRLKKIFTAGLALALVVLLCACGGSAEGEDTGGLSAGSDTRGVAGASAGIPGNANAALAKENVYGVSEVEIPGLADRGSVQSVARWDGRVYAVMKITDWENGSKYNKYYVLSMDEDGNNLQTVFLELPGDGEGEETAAEPESDLNMQLQEDTRYSDFVTGADGRTYALRQCEYFYADDPTVQSVNEQHQYVCCWDADGRLLWQLEPCGDSGEDVSVWAVFPAADGSLELLMTGENTAYRLPVGGDGSLSESNKVRLSGEAAKALGNCRRLIRREDGSCLLLCRDAEDGLSLIKYDLQTDTPGEAFGLPDDISLSGVVFSSGIDSDLIYAGRDGVFTYDMGDGRGSLKVNYVNSDRNITDVTSLLELDGTHFLMFYREDYARELKVGIFAYVEPENIPDREVIVLAGLAVNGGIRKRIIQYNRENDRYRVALKEYESYEDLNLDIVSGHMPDILMAEGLPMESYIAKGLFADVGKLIEEDGELSRTEFMENVFDAYSVDGKLMYVVPSFDLLTMVGKASLVGDGSGWSMESMMEALDKMGPDARLLDGLSRSVFMKKAMKYCGNDFIDTETGKCSFDSPAFIEMMKLACTLPEERSWAGESGEGEYELQYLKERTLLLELDIYAFGQAVDERLFYQLNGYLGGDYTFVGFPAGSGEAAGNGGGALVCAENLMALSAGSENTGGAWDFARYYLTEEYQRSLEGSLPVCRHIFEEWAAEETRRSYYTDERGDRVEYDLTLDQDGGPVVVPPFSQKQLEQLIAYVESATAVPFEDDAVMNIINEELGSYFSGQKTAEDVAAVIQNRVQLYVQEKQ